MKGTAKTQRTKSIRRDITKWITENELGCAGQTSRELFPSVTSSRTFKASFSENPKISA